MRPTEDINRLLDDAVTHHRAGRLMEASAVYNAIVARDPQHFDALHLLGLAHHQRGDPAQGAKLMTAALKKQDDAAARTNLALALGALGRRDEALTHLDRAIALKPDFVEAFNNRGNLLREMLRLPEALASLDRAVALNPNDAEAHRNRANVLLDMRRADDALAAFELAVALTGATADALNGRATALSALDRRGEALADYDRALALDPTHRDARINRGLLYENMGDMDAALADYRAVMARAPGFAQAHWNEAVILLRRGDFATGWKKHEWRRHLPHAASLDRAFPQPHWDGAPLDGKTILLHVEQGYGDAIQFCRYVPMVAARGGRVVLEARAPLLPLLRQLAGVDALIVRGDPLPHFDTHASLMSLPLAFGTLLDTIPADVSYLVADPERRDAWMARLGKPTARRVGIAWSGSRGNFNDRLRSIALVQLLEALPPDIELHGLQNDVRDNDAPVFATSSVKNHTAHLPNFGETAALASAMDLVITVDTSIAHLAGALGKPTWVLLPYVADWRWLRDRDDSPWYPTMRLFRQPAPGNWPAALAAVRSALTSR